MSTPECIKQSDKSRLPERTTGIDTWLTQIKDQATKKKTALTADLAAAGSDTDFTSELKAEISATLTKLDAIITALS